MSVGLKMVSLHGLTLPVVPSYRPTDPLKVDSHASSAQDPCQEEIRVFWKPLISLNSTSLRFLGGLLEGYGTPT